MGKLTTGELSKWVQKKQGKKRKSSAIVEFIAVKTFVAEAIEAGYSIKDIWGYLKEGGQIRSTYETFRNHVNRHLAANLAAKKQKPAKDEKQEDKLERSVGPNETELDNPEKSKPIGIASFNYNPKIDDKDLF
ncbi:TraK family protein [Marinobacter sp.]|uniref:TraK family protein n=1 Tax=Marinobacter sp. TaxID=50741 RepID=UPI003A934730